ncbi:unnamed protein product, partial [Schistosoma curassoni]|uniref:Uncharacterized protein n=1 Tax=Schistosoma curassoni TaxID=6186 RepID=A0A183L568_9TREM
FSSSNSFSSRSSTNRFERIEQQQKTHRHNSVNSKNDKQIKSQTKHKHRQKLHQNSLSTNIIAVPDQGGQAYFTDLIHVPPLPTSGLFGRQNLIYLEYSLIVSLVLFSCTCDLERTDTPCATEARPEFPVDFLQLRNSTTRAVKLAELVSVFQLQREIFTSNKS